MKGLNRSNYEHSLISRNWYDITVRSDEAPIFVGGCGRSGTTLFREILNRHPRIFCGPETSMFGLPFLPSNIAPYWGLDKKELQKDVINHKNLVSFAEAFFQKHAKAAGKERWADKTPNNIRAIEKILTWFPKAKFIHILRDGRDVVCSLRHHPKEKFVKNVLVPLQTNNPISFCATRWLRDTMKGFAFRSHPRYLEVRYENLVFKPDAEIRRVCSFIEEEYTPNMLQPEESNSNVGVLKDGRLINNHNASNEISSKSVGRWRRDLNISEQKQFNDIAGELLITSGYVKNHSWLSDEP